MQILDPQQRVLLINQKKPSKINTINYQFLFSHVYIITTRISHLFFLFKILTTTLPSFFLGILYILNEEQNIFYHRKIKIKKEIPIVFFPFFLVVCTKKKRTANKKNKKGIVMCVPIYISTRVSLSIWLSPFTRISSF